MTLFWYKVHRLAECESGKPVRVAPAFFVSGVAPPLSNLSSPEGARGFGAADILKTG